MIPQILYYIVLGAGCKIKELIPENFTGHAANALNYAILKSTKDLRKAADILEKTTDFIKEWETK